MLYPQQTASRFVESLDGIWDFKLDDGSAFESKWFDAPLADAMTMPVPASYNDLKEGIDFRDFCGWAFYQRAIAVPEFVRSQRVMLRFSAVTHHTKVYLNGKLVCEHVCGFLPFEVQINDYLEPGDNLLTVAVDNVIDYTTLPVGGKANMMSGLLGGMGDATEDAPKKKVNNPNFDFFNYAGITRPVYIYTTPAEHIDDVELVADVQGETTDAPSATVSYKVAATGDAACKVEMFDVQGGKVAEGEGLEGELKLDQVTLWQPGAAYLYRVKVTFGEDVYELPYGVRTVRVEGTRFLINGKPFYFKGYGKHEDTFPAGRGENMPMNVKDLSLMKWQGANSFRTSHYPYSEEMMRLCDAEGIVVIDETTAVGVNLQFGGGANFGGEKITTFDPEHGVQTQEAHKQVIRDLVARDKNHACVVMWSIANEPDSSAEGAYDYFKPLYDLARELDPQKRPCTLVSVQGTTAVTDCSAKLSDAICLNRYYGWYFGGPNLVAPFKAMRAELDEWAKLGKPIIFTEFGADTVAGMHDTTPVMYTEEYQVDYYKANLAVMDDYPCVVGEQVWNFADFATSQSLLRVQGNKKGLFTRDRKPKLAAHFFRERWHEVPDFGYKA